MLEFLSSLLNFKKMQRFDQNSKREPPKQRKLYKTQRSIRRTRPVRFFSLKMFGKSGSRRSENFMLLFLTFVLVFLLGTYFRRKAEMMTEDKFKEIMAHRKTVRNEICERYGSSDLASQSNWKMHYYTFVSKKNRYWWCPVYKAGSTSWIYNLLRIEGMKESLIKDYENLYGKSAPTTILRQLLPDTLKSEFSGVVKDPLYKSFMVVRHPFTRIVSAYRDKLERYDPKYYEEFGKGMVDKYRERALRLFNYDTFGRAGGQKEQLVDLPSFWEFVQSIIDNKETPQKMDEHWRPATQVCQVCTYEFDYVLKLEDLEREQFYFAKEMGFDISLEHRHKGGTLKHGAGTSEITRRYFAQISQDDMEKLKAVYKFDFLLYDYNPDQY